MATLDEIEDLIQKPRTTLDEIESLIAVREAELAKTETPTPFIDQVGRTFLNNLVQLPKLPGQALAAGAAAIEGGAAAVTGGEFDFGTRFEEQKGKFPASLLLKAPTTTIQEIEAFTGTFSKECGRRPVDQPGVENIVPLFTERFGPAFDEELARINQEEARIAKKFPFKTKAGEIGGDVLTLLTGRLPFAKGINIAETAFVAKKFSDSLTNPGVRKIVELVLDSKAVRALKRGTGRAVETGAEASVLSLLKGGDPLETAGFAAGGQLAGSVILTGIKGVGKHPILASAFGMAALIQMAKETTPGGPDNFIDSLEKGFEKVWWGLMLGAVSTLAGAGRLRGGDIAKNLPKFTDALATSPRATSISLLKDYFNATPDEQNTIDATLTQLQQDPGFFGPEITNKLLKAMQAGNLTSALREVQ